MQIQGRGCRDPGSDSGSVLSCFAKDAAVDLQWTEVTDATEYHVKRRETMGAHMIPSVTP
jgi:hypothetical protein